MFLFDITPEELAILNAAFGRLCDATASEDQRDTVQLLLFELIQRGPISVDALVADARSMLKFEAAAAA